MSVIHVLLLPMNFFDPDTAISDIDPKADKRPKSGLDDR
jgi:hypothetical protein